MRTFSSARPLDRIGRAGRIGLAAAAIGAAFVLGTIVLQVADGDLRDPIELAAVPDPTAAQGTGDGFHEVEGERVERLGGPAPDDVDPRTTLLPATGADRSTGATSTTAGAPGAGPVTTRGPGATLPSVTTPTVTTPAPVPAPTTPPVGLPTVTVPTLSLPPVTLPPVGEPLPPPPTVALPTISVPPITVPDPTLPVTVPTLPPVTLPPLFPSAAGTR